MGAANSACPETQCLWDQCCNGKILYSNGSSNSGVESKFSTANRAYWNCLILFFHKKIKKRHFQVRVGQELGTETWPKQGFGGPAWEERSFQLSHAHVT